MVSPKTITILSAVTCILTLVSIGLTASHAVSHSYVKYKSSGLVIRTMANVSPCPPAVKVKAEDDNMKIVISCPYRAATKAIALISLVSLQILLILVCCKLKNRVKSVVIILFAIIEFPLLLAAGIMMIADMASGKKQLSDLSSDYSSQPFEYVVNVIFVFIGMVCGGVATYFAYTNRPPTHPSESNNSMSVTKPHWTEGESRGNDFVKPTPQAHNISTFRDFQGETGFTSHNTSTVYLNQNNRNTPPSPRDRRGAPQNGQYRRNSSYEDYPPQTRPRQQSNANNLNHGDNQQQGNNENERAYRNPSPQRAQNLMIETPNANQNNYNSNHNDHQNNFNNNNANRMTGPPRNNYSGSNNNNGANSYERGPERSPQRNNQSQMYTSNNNHNDPISYERGRSPQRNNQSQIYTNNIDNNNGPERNPQRDPERNFEENPQRSPQRNNQSQMYTNNNNNNGPISYERGPERYPDSGNPQRSPDNRSYNNHGGNPTRLNAALSRIAGNAYDNGPNNRGYLNYGNEPNNERNTKDYDPNTLDYYRPENRGRARSINQNNFEEGNYQRANQRKLSQNNGEKTLDDMYYNEMGLRPYRNYN